VILPSQRVLAVGMNGDGKSELLASIANRVRVRRVLIDPKADWQVAGQPRYQLSSSTVAHAQVELEGIDWDQPIVHVQPTPAERGQLEALYARIDQLAPPLLVWTDEAYMTSSGSWEPRGMRSLQVTGRSRGIGHLAATQRPVDVAMCLRSEADHVMLFRNIGLDDLESFTRRLPYVRDYHPSVAQLLEQLPPYGFLWLDKNARELTICDPIPLASAAGAIAKRPGR
jgi:hypothetical protein